MVVYVDIRVTLNENSLTENVCDRELENALAVGDFICDTIKDADYDTLNIEVIAVGKKSPVTVNIPVELFDDEK